MTLTEQNQSVDHALGPTVRAKSVLGTHLASDAPTDALFVARGSGALGDAQGALSVAAGAGVVRGVRHEVGDQPVDIERGDGLPRRDVVYLADTGQIEVERGTPAKRRWPTHFTESEKTTENAVEPAPPDMASVAGLALATVSIDANAGTLGTGTIEDVRAPAPAVTGGGGTVDDNALQSSLDDAVVAVAPGLGVLDAIDATEPTPVQAAVNAIDAVGISADGRGGAGAVLLPPGLVESPGGIASVGLKSIIGWGTEASELRCTDSSGSLFATGGAGFNRREAFLDGLHLSGGDRGARTGGSAIAATATSANSTTEDGTGHGFHTGHLKFTDWGGPDPVIDAFGSFSDRHEYLRGIRYDGSFYRGPGFDTHFGDIHINHSDRETPVMDFDGPNGPVDITILNCGGAVGWTLNVDKSFAAASSFHAGHINVEPDNNNAGTLSGAPAPVTLYGASPASINSISHWDKLTSDYTVALGASVDYSSANNDGPGRNRIGSVMYPGSAAVAPVGVLDAPKTPSWYWGPRSDIDYGGFSTRAVRPMAEPDEPPADLSTVTGWYDGHVMADSGANTSRRGTLCVWDATANAGAGAWVPQDGSATF